MDTRAMNVSKLLRAPALLFLLLVGGCGSAREPIPEDSVTGLVPQPLEFVEWWNARYDATQPSQFGTWGAACSNKDPGCETELARLRSQFTDPAQRRGGSLCTPRESDDCCGFLLVTRGSEARALRHPEDVAAWLAPIDSMEKLGMLMQTTHYRWRQLNVRRIGNGWGMTFSDVYGEAADYEICVSRDGVIRDAHPSCD